MHLHRWPSHFQTHHRCLLKPVSRYLWAHLSNFPLTSLFSFFSISPSLFYLCQSFNKHIEVMGSFWARKWNRIEISSLWFLSNSSHSFAHQGVRQQNDHYFSGIRHILFRYRCECCFKWLFGVRAPRKFTSIWVSIYDEIVSAMCTVHTVWTN